MKSASQMDGRVTPEGCIQLERSALSPEEAHRVLVEWNRTDALYPEGKILHQLFEEQTGRTPQAIAVIFKGKSLTYRALDRRAEILASILSGRGVESSCLVPLCLERSLEMMIGILGILKAGGAYVPLESDLPDERLTFLLQDTGAKIVLTQTRFVDRLARLGGGQVEVMAIDWDWEQKEKEEKDLIRENRRVSPTDPVYVIYTSGTTGRPKGVLLEHRALVNRIHWMQQTYQLESEDRVLQKTPYSFDVSGWEFFWPLTTGACLVFAKPGGHKDPQYLRHLIQNSGITVCHFVPSMLRIFLSTGERGGCPSLKKVICSGEPLPVTLKDSFFEQFPDRELHNLYGPTEAAIDVTAYPCRREDRIVPIGKPIANTRIYILDGELKPVPVGSTGELCIGGVGLARGYLNQPELTAEKFVASPFQAGARIYRTGDLARWLPDGNIECLGRADHQIKIRGNRVELGEIESVILEQEGVSACAVVAAGGEHEHLRLAAYVAPHERQAAGVYHQLRQSRQGRLDGIKLHALGNGLEVAHLNASETEFLYREIFVNGGYLRHGIRLEDGDCALDVGANIGLFSLQLFLARERLRIHAFEPIPEIHRLLAVNADLFGGAWTSHACGLSDAAGTADFTYYPHLSMVSGGAASQDEEVAVVRSVILREQGSALPGVAPEEIEGLLRHRLISRTVQCELRTVSDVIREQQLEVIHLLKIDVEKMEERVLGGIGEDDWGKIRQIVIEAHDTGGRLERITRLLAEKGYQVETEQEELLGASRIFQVYARQAGLPAKSKAAWRPESESQQNDLISAAGEHGGRKTAAWIGRAEYVRRIRDGLRAKLPDYMIPAVVAPLEQLPLTSNGKIDRKALARVEPARPVRPAGAMPRSAIEERLAGIWEELLGLVEIGSEEGFFELGGNSLLAVRAADRISREFGCQYPVALFLQHARIREMSDYLEARQALKRTPDIPMDHSGNGQGVLSSSDVKAVEAVLNRHPSVRRSVVVNRSDGPNGGTITAFVVPNEDYFRARNAAKPARSRLDPWVSVWEQNYQPILNGVASSAERLNGIGYTRSDTGAPIPEEELRENIDLVVRQVMAGAPQRILEIGCGSGMLLFQLAGQVERYLATDLSRNALRHIQASLRESPFRDRVSCFQGDALDLESVPVEEADLVVINSVVQYFPGIDYLTTLIETLARRLPPKARIFIGDARDLRLHRMFYAWTLLGQCSSSTSKRRFRRLLADRIKLEKELVIHPAYFRNLRQVIPRLRQVRIGPKQGRFQNELIRFRYDVFLYLDDAPPEGAVPRICSWRPEDAMLENWAANSGGPAGQAVYLTNIPNQRLWKERSLLAWLDSPGEDAPISEVLQAMESSAGTGLDPFACLAWAESNGRRASLHWEHEREDGRFELYLQPKNGPGGELPDNLQNSFAATPPSKMANSPSLPLEWEEHGPILKQALREELPGCRLPSRFLLLHELPVLENGEVDRDELAGRKEKTGMIQPAAGRSSVSVQAEYYDQCLAIIGMSCAFAGAAHYEQFWRNLRQGVESARFYSEAELRALGVAEDRMRDPRFVPMRLAIEGRAVFDADFFNLSPRQAAHMDPQARLLLIHSWQAMEDAGYAPGFISDTAVFMSASNNFYTQALGLREAELQGMDGHEAGLFGQPGMIPAWISYHLGLKGPSLFVQNLCCSSMTGLRLACRCLLAKEAGYALVGAASLFAPDRIGYLHEPGLSLSPDGRCRPFEAAAGGMVEGEGVGVVLLKRAADAIRDRDAIYALLRGVGLSQDGAEKAGFNAPSFKGQAEAIRKAFQETGISPQSVQYIEAHGNGTPLGDSLEVAALSEGYRLGRERKQAIGLGSTKPNIGNVDTVTGLAGCIKIALSLSQRCFPPIAHYRRPNPAMGLADSLFYVVERLENWPVDGPPVRIAQHVYSVGGMNAHAIYEDFRRPNEAEVEAPKGPVLAPLSARSEERLRAYAGKLLAFLRARPAAEPEAEARYLVDLAYTLQTGRQAMKCRVVFLVRSLEELIEKLDRFIRGEPGGENIYQGEASRAKDLWQLIGDEGDQRALARQRILEERWDRVANLWVRGAAVDWHSLYSQRPPFRIHLPTYPFEEKEHWLDGPEPKQIQPSVHHRHLPPAGASRESTADLSIPKAELSRDAAPEKCLQAARPDLSPCRSAPDATAALLRRVLADLLKVPEEELDGDRPFRETGLDSVGLIRLSNRLNREHGFKVTPAMLFEHSTPRRLAHYLAADWPLGNGLEPGSGAGQPGPGANQTEVPSLSAPVVATRRREPIAIIGMSGRFPQAANLEEFWDNLVAGRDCIREAPAERWPGQSADDTARNRAKWGGFIDGLAEFDPLFFNLSPREAVAMDPQNRLLMMHVWLAMEDAGYSASRLSGTNTGLFIGTGDTGYAHLAASENPQSSYDILGVYPFFGPNRMSYFLDVTGPSEPINTGCSSSLVAVHKAVEALENGQCDLAFAGGVNTLPTPHHFASFSEMGFLSEDGRCRAFSARADGFGRGEGVGIIALKRLSEAEAAGDPIHAVILGSAQNHGGRANSFTAPNPAAQAQVIEAACRKAGIDAGALGYIETHGTATRLGDSVEIEALKKAFSAAARPGQNGRPVCGLGSVKSNIGHLELAAGIAGLLKVVLQLRHKTLVRSLHCEELNPFLQLEGSPFYIVRQNAPWQTIQDQSGRDLPRRAGISSFGVGGVNAHVVVEEYVPRADGEPEDETGREPFLVVLSAKREEALRESARRLLDYLGKNRGLSRPNLRRLAYTLQVGRDAMRERLALLVNSADELGDGLKAYLESDPLPSHCFRGCVQPGESWKAVQAEGLIGRKEYRPLLDFWVNGGSVDWNLLYGPLRPTRLSLPGYPFAREHYWVTSEPVVVKKGSNHHGAQQAPGSPRNGNGSPAGGAKEIIQALDSSEDFQLKKPALPGSITTCLLEKTWREEAAVPNGNSPHASRTLFLVNEESIGLIPILGREGAIVVGNHRVPAGQADFVMDFRDASSGRDLAGKLVEVCEGVTRIIDLGDLYRHPQDADDPKLGKLVIYQALIGTFAPRHILFFTQGLQSFKTSSMSLAGARLIGLIKMLGAEYNHVHARAIDIDQAGFEDPEWFRQVLENEFRSVSGEVEVCYRNQRRYAPRLEMRSAPSEEPWFRASEDAVYVIAGGTRGIGLEIAFHLASKGARKLALLGFHPLPPKKDWDRAVRDNQLSPEERAKLARLIDLNNRLAELRIYTGPLTNWEALRAFMDQVRAQCGPIRGIIHSAGAYPELNSRAFVTREVEQMQRIFEPKMDGLEALHELFRDEDLEFFVTFTSLSGLVPRLARGLSDYAMANTYADHFASYQFHQHHRARYRTITWVDWNDTGYAARMSPQDKVRLEQSLGEIGLASYSTPDGCRLFDLAMGTPNRHWVLPCYLDPPAFQAARAELLSVSEQKVSDWPPAAALDPAILDRLDQQLERWKAEQGRGKALSAALLEEFIDYTDIQKLDAARIQRIYDLLFPALEDGGVEGTRRDALAATIRSHLFNVLKVPELDDATPLQEYGLDSISAMVFSNRLSKALRQEVDPSWLASSPTVQSLAAHLASLPETNRV